MRQLLHVINFIGLNLILIFGLTVQIQALETPQSTLDVKEQYEILQALSDNIDKRGFLRTMDEIQDFNLEDFHDNPTIGDPDMYLYILNETMYQPLENTLDYAADDLGLFKSKEDYLGYYSANYSPEIEASFQENLDLVETTHYLELKSIAFELFVNGNTSDSSFDLLEDLNTLEYYLFGENLPWEYFQLPEDSRRGSTPTQLTSDVREIPEERVSAPLEESSSSIQATNSDDPQENQDQPVQDINPDQCAVTPEVFDQVFPGGEGDPSTPPPQDEESEPTPPQENPAPPISTVDLPLDLLEFQSFAGPTPFLCNRTEFTIDEYTSGSPEERYCFYVEAFPQPIGFQTPKNDCTLCNFNEIYNELLKVVEQPLIPHKITGQYFEPPFCKEHVLQKLNSINVTLEARPLFPKDSPFKYLDSIDPAQISSQIRTTQDVGSPVEINFEEDRSIDEFIESYNQNLAQQLVRTQQSNIELRYKEGNLVQKGVFTQINARMELFNSLLTNLKDIIENMNEISHIITTKPKCNA